VEGAEVKGEGGAEVGRKGEMKEDVNLELKEAVKKDGKKK
jgi:hypothetical protein